MSLFAAEPLKLKFDIPSDSAETAIKRLSEQAGVDVLLPTNLARTVRTNPVKGEFTAREALQAMLVGTGLVAEQDQKTGALTVRKEDSEAKKNEPRIGTISGRVQNSATGEYLRNARVTVKSTDLTAFTDESGTYRLDHVPLGAVVLETFYTGMETLQTFVNLDGGTPVQQNIGLKIAGKDEVVTLGEFVVTTVREREGAALAINEQRFADNMKTVVATDEFGDVAEGNVAEFLKFLPGVTVQYQGGNGRYISLNGVPSENVPVTINGFNIASAQGIGNRAVQSDMVNINNLSRIEVSFSPTPESEGTALAGSVNMVPRSAFERSKQEFKVNAFAAFRKSDPTMELTRPGFDFSWVNPVSDRFGVTLAGGVSSNFSPQSAVTITQRGANTATNGAAFPNTTVDKPYMSGFVLQDEPKITVRQSLGATFDYKLTPKDRISLGFTYSTFKADFDTYSLTYNMTNVSSFSPTSTTGTGSLQLTRGNRTRLDRTVMPMITWRHYGPEWKAEGGYGYSEQLDRNKDVERNIVRNITMQRANVKMVFNDITPMGPQSITVTDNGTGAVLNPFTLSTYSITQVGNGNFDLNNDIRNTVYGNLRHDFSSRVPLALKIGFDVHQTLRERRGGGQNWDYLGADGKASTTPVGNDDSPVAFFGRNRQLPYGYPSVELPSNTLVYKDILANPSHYSNQDNNNYRNAVTQSARAEETISAAYLRFDTSFFNDRLKLIGGLRGEQTNVTAWGPLTDPTLNYQRDASGKILHNSSGSPILIVPTTNALGVSKLTYIERGTRTDKEYLRWFPSLNANYQLQEDLVLRGAVYKTVGRPLFTQYSGGISLPNIDQPASSSNRITVNNAGIKPWEATSATLRLEKYLKGVGLISVGAYRRNIKDFFSATVFPVTPEFLTLYGLDQTTYGGYDVSTQSNLPDVVHIDGIEFSYKQTLTFLPHWARGVQVFFNGTAQHISAAPTADLSGYVPRRVNWGVGVTRPRWNAHANFSYSSLVKNNLVTGAGIEANTYNVTPAQTIVDLQGEWYFYKQFSLYANLRNVSGVPSRTLIYGPNTPAYARFRAQTDYSALFTFGVKATF